jgi:catechol 2,3-dioxygenase-like lactoylglutathione lyase family enzyme
MQGVERLSQETRVPQCRIGGKCAAFRQKLWRFRGIYQLKSALPSPLEGPHGFCYNKGMKVLFVAGYGPITTETKESTAFYRESLGLSFKEEADGYFHTEELKGVKSFALWPLSQAAQSCFGVNEWPADLPTPTSWLEFDVEDVAQASEELKAKGYTLLIAARKEPWGQTVTRLLSPEGILVGLTYTPWMRESES